MSYRKSACCVFFSRRWAVSGLGLLLVAFVLSGCPAWALQLSPTSTTNFDEKLASPEDHADLTLEAVSPDLDFLDSGDLPESLDQIKAMQDRVKSLSERVKDATVSIRMRGGQGTGVLVSSDGVILTAAHVIGRPRQMALITFRDGTRASAITLGVEAEKDSGMLKVLAMLPDPVTVEESDGGEENTEDDADESKSTTDDKTDSDETDSDKSDSNETDSNEGAESEPSDSDDEATKPSDSDDEADDPSESNDDSGDTPQSTDSSESKSKSKSEIDFVAKAFENEDLPIFDYLDMGVSHQLNDGQWVIAVGHPGGLDEDRGMVLRVGRIINQRDTALRSDCTLVGGDSGGPLVDMNGNVIAIHSRIGGRIQDNIHVPVDVFSDTWDELTQGLKIGERGKLGLSMTSDSNIVSRVVKRGPADKAGINVGDIITAVNAKKVTSKQEFAKALKGSVPYEKVNVTVKRGSRELDLEVMLADAELLQIIEARQKRMRNKEWRHP